MEDTNKMSVKQQTDAVSNPVTAMMQEVGKMLEIEIGKVPYPEFVVDEVKIPMKDGTCLCANLYQPEESGPRPVIVVRNPYVVNVVMYTHVFGPVFARNGYALLDVQVRGTGTSEGEWNPFVNERGDGKEVIDWVGEQSWCDGNIATYGASYLGFTQWAIADYDHPMLKTHYISVIGSDLHQMHYRRGMYRPEIATMWAAQMMEENRFHVWMGQENHDLAWKAYNIVPQIELGEQMKNKQCQWYETWATSPDKSASYWSTGSLGEIREVPGKVKRPICLHGGWFDIMLPMQIDTYHSLPEEVRKQSRFIIGPWSHGGSAGGTLEYPNEAKYGVLCMKDTLRWFDHHLKGLPYKEKTGTMEVYCIGDNRWKTWKYTGAETEAFCMYLGDHTFHANPAESGQIEYTYDPNNPVESVGGTMIANNRNPQGTPECSTEQPEVGYRPDVISFVSQELGEDMTIAGSVKVTLYVASSAPATAFTVKLIEVFEDGRSFNIRDDITDIRWAEDETIQDYTPGTVRKLTFKVLDTCWKLKAKSRLRLDVSSSNFPAYHRHPNTETIWGRETSPQMARQIIYFGGNYPAALELPIWKE